jgi:hypothetical protein
MLLNRHNKVKFAIIQLYRRCFRIEFGSVLGYEKCAMYTVKRPFFVNDFHFTTMMAECQKPITNRIVNEWKWPEYIYAIASYIDGSKRHTKDHLLLLTMNDDDLWRMRNRKKRDSSSNKLFRRLTWMPFTFLEKIVRAFQSFVIFKNF